MNELGPAITREELYKALKNLIYTYTSNIITNCYKEGKILNDSFTSKCITIPKKGNANDCSNYRKISILSHASKILLNIIKHRLKNKIKNYTIRYIYILN